jgi:hypothetical protein
MGSAVAVPGPVAGAGLLPLFGLRVRGSIVFASRSSPPDLTAARVISPGRKPGVFLLGPRRPGRWRGFVVVPGAIVVASGMRYQIEMQQDGWRVRDRQWDLTAEFGGILLDRLTIEEALVTLGMLEACERAELEDIPEAAAAPNYSRVR